ncbi:cytochrome oxidase assembly protein [Maribacter sp. 4U21]|uniref:COX15/CtaA family protein n=1 Tax=Maribacter sp. 4U21 TaxID=1889779 RepID=UPI000C14EE45|nr:COX15/CtaA family protein [Maribacter sp. 4U21]PIB28072.1 cytochrome oxidase assembly protein [Maribacter sp. 4U21]
MVSFRKIAKTALILVYLVIVAGAVVRMTGSGMGCPDWPKCFGYYIPPTEASVLEWRPNKKFEKGQVIILNETLQVAKEDIITSLKFSNENWEQYTKHDYAIFNPWHTWIEYINRLLGALAGLATLILAFVSIKYWKNKRQITILSWLVVLGMGFQAWLGATVVYSVLEPVKITTHMLMALLIVALLLYIIFRVNKEDKRISFDKNTLVLAVVALIFTLVQVVLGTQVRQFVDDQIDLVGENAKNLWLQDPTFKFYFHRSFSIAILLINSLLAYRIITLKLGHIKIFWVLFILTVEIFSGIAMYYLDFPFASQPLHLVLASILFGVQFYLVLDALKPKNSLKTS